MTRRETRSPKSPPSQGPQAQTTMSASSVRPSSRATRAPSGVACPRTISTPEATAESASAFVATAARSTPASGSWRTKPGRWGQGSATAAARPPRSRRSTAMPTSRSGARCRAPSRPRGGRASPGRTRRTAMPQPAPRARATASAHVARSVCTPRRRRASCAEGGSRRPRRTRRGRERPARRASPPTPRPPAATPRRRRAPLRRRRSPSRHRPTLPRRVPCRHGARRQPRPHRRVDRRRPPRRRRARRACSPRPTRPHSTRSSPRSRLGDAATFVDACRRRARRPARLGGDAGPGPRPGDPADRPPGRGQQGGARAARHPRDRQAATPSRSARSRRSSTPATSSSGEGRRLYGQTVPSEMPDKQLFTFRTPVGVAAIITAGNFPVAVPVLVPRAGAAVRQRGRLEAGRVRARARRGARAAVPRTAACPRAC